MYRAHPPSLQRLIANSFGAHLNALARQVETARFDATEESIHRLRVSGRRLRTDLDVFAGLIPEKKRRRWRKAIRRVSGALGRARDLDAYGESLKSIMQTPTKLLAPESKPGIERLWLRQRQERVLVQSQICAAADEFQASGVSQRMLQWLQHLSAKRIRKAAKAWPEVATAMLACRYARVLGYSRYVSNPREVEKLHALRIAIKRLRYTLEAVFPLYKGKLKEPIKVVKDWQRQLGEIHDYDVWGARLTVFAEEERRRYIDFFGHANGFGELQPGIDALAQQFGKRRGIVYGEFLETWNRERTGTVWKFLFEEGDSGSKRSKRNRKARWRRDFCRPKEPSSAKRKKRPHPGDES